MTATTITITSAANAQAAALGVRREWRNSFRSGRIEAVLMGSLLGLCVSGGGVLLVAGVWFGGKLLLS